MKEEELKQELEDNKADMVFPTNEGYVKVENIERIQDVIISKSLRVSKITEESELKGKTFKAKITIKDTVTLILLLAEEEGTPESFSPVKPSPKQRIKFKEWEPLAKSKTGTIYKEVVDRILGEYKDGVEPSIEILSQIMQEMYGNHLKETSIASYVSVYKRYIRENIHVEKTLLTKTPSGNRGGYKEGVTCLREIPIEQVVEIWNLLPDKFSYKQVKALIPVGTMQSGSRIDATNYVIREFKENAAFECKETSPGIFSKKENGGEE